MKKIMISLGICCISGGVFEAFPKEKDSQLSQQLQELENYKKIVDLAREYHNNYVLKPTFHRDMPELKEEESTKIMYQAVLEYIKKLQQFLRERYSE